MALVKENVEGVDVDPKSPGAVVRQDLVGPADVHLERLSSTACLCNPLCRALGSFEVDVECGDCSAFFSEAQADAASDAACPTRHDSHFVLHPHDRNAPFMVCGALQASLELEVVGDPLHGLDSQGNEVL